MLLPIKKITRATGQRFAEKR